MLRNITYPSDSHFADTALGQNRIIEVPDSPTHFPDIPNHRHFRHLCHHKCLTPLRGYNLSRDLLGSEPACPGVTAAHISSIRNSKKKKVPHLVVWKSLICRNLLCSLIPEDVGVAINLFITTVESFFFKTHQRLSPKTFVRAHSRWQRIRYSILKRQLHALQRQIPDELGKFKNSLSCDFMTDFFFLRDLIKFLGLPTSPLYIS